MTSPRRIAYRVGLGAAVSLLVALTVGTLAALTFLNTRTVVFKLVHERVDELLLGLGARIDNHMLGAVPAVELVRSIAESSPDRIDADAMARRFLLILRANPGFSWVTWSGRNGDFIGAQRTASGQLRISQSTFDKGSGEAREYTVDDTGKWTLALHDRNSKYDPREEDFFAPAMAAGKRTWIGPYIFYDEGVPGVTCAVPLIGADGVARGVFTVDFDLELLSRFVSGLRFGESGRVFILEPDNDVIAHPMLRMTPVAGQGKKGKIPSASQVTDPVLQAFVKAHPTVSKATEANDQFSLDIGGRQYLAAQRVIRIDNGLTWVLGAIAPADDFLHDVERTRNLAIIIIASAVAVGILLAVWLARRITSPLTTIADEMQLVGTFQLEDRPPLETRFREVAMMDASLSKMKRGLRSFAYYVPTGLVRSVLESGQEATLAGEMREMTVYFSDIAGFTTKAESLRPDELVRNLSNYLDEMTTIIDASQGTIDKFIGDAIMAFWGAPLPVPDHAALACEAALRSQRRLAELRSLAPTPWLSDLHMRIGIASGEMLVGNVGTCERFNYTVMGDTVNLASRLESLSKQYGTEILVSGDTYEAAKSRVIARPVDLVQVKGKLQGVWVYELLCFASDEDPAARELARVCTEAFNAYRSRDFQRAADGFRRALALRPADRAAAVLLERTLGYVASPPPPDWNGAYVAAAK